MTVAVIAILVLQSFRPDDAFACRLQETGCFGIHLVDGETGRGVPLVRLQTTGGTDYWTDSNGWIAFDEPGLLGQEVWFSIESAGYEVAADGFGFRGVRLATQSGSVAEVRLKRTNLAERLYRITGQGIYSDTIRLGRQDEIPAGIPALNAGVMGQDSVQMVRFGESLFWLWGDTNLHHYPLGVFHVTAATSPLPGDGFAVEHGIPLRYFQDVETGRARKMIPEENPGAVWLWGLVNVPGKDSAETLVAHYSRHLSLGNMVEHGMAVWDPQQELFHKVATLELSNTWRFPRGQAVRHADSDGDYVYFAEPFVTTRVPARLADMLLPERYESWAWDASQSRYHWQQREEPATQESETRLIADGTIPREDSNFQIVEAGSGRSVTMHRGSVNWNEFRNRWIMIACEANAAGDPSHLGEIWYAESDSITGPWKTAIKIASHPKYSFYNPRHHRVLDQQGGRIIYFEGTYTSAFSAAPARTPRYDYNQIMYRLDLARAP